MTRFAMLVVCAFAACGGTRAGEAARAPEEESRAGAGSEAERAAREEQERDDGMQVEGLDGTIDPADVEAGVGSATAQIARCFGERYDAIEVLSGDFTLAFRIGRDGRVITARLVASSIGDRETERCVVRAARAIRFARPKGGEADASHSLAIDLPDDVRPPVDWPTTKAQRLVTANGAPALKARCGAESAEVVVTAYVESGGRALAVGAAGDVEAAALDCVADAVRGWRFSDPGSYPAKVSVRF